MIGLSIIVVERIRSDHNLPDELTIITLHNIIMLLIIKFI